MLRLQNGVAVQPWYRVAVAVTLSRCLISQQRFEEALEGCEIALPEAERAGGRLFVLALKMMRVQAQVGLRLRPSADFLVEYPGIPISLRADRWLTTAKCLAGVLQPSRALSLADRARRAFSGIGAVQLAAEADSLKSEIQQNNDAAGQGLPHDIDAAATLLELGGHPHILAREAMAVLQGAGCADAMAVVALGPSGPQVIDVHGCDERRAMAMARKPDGFEVVALGQHREEPWQIVVEPRPELEHRCAFIAIRKVIDTAVVLDRFRRDEEQRAALWPADALEADTETIWASEQMAEVLQVARRIATNSLSVLITGETGTGKEVLARTIHRASDRASKAFLPFNCTAVPRDMLESQLFGHRKGAFTGADTAFPGVVRAAAGGTLFLDEIAEIPLDLQVKLLRFLEAHEIHPLGEPHPITVDVRVIAATNAPLEQLVAEGRLREDLFYRLNVIRLQLPPLRERREEIPPLVEHYLRRCGDEQKKGRLTISDETLEYLLLYSWPGNLRQLANEIRRVVAMADPNATVTPAMLSPEIQASRRTIPAA
ncbi:MAG: sigma-54-dependent Fis family transcriptional regulator, partial [Acidobacteria bacterium]|nr:sigma-54-dependent Fis family transcriptional regulator [Acidobacteriota bacterium]